MFLRTIPKLTHANNHSRWWFSSAILSSFVWRAKITRDSFKNTTWHANQKHLMFFSNCNIDSGIFISIHATVGACYLQIFLVILFSSSCLLVSCAAHLSLYMNRPFPFEPFFARLKLKFCKIRRLVCPQHPFGYPYHYRALCKIPKRSGNQHRSKRDFVTFWFNTLRPRPNGSHFPGDIFKYIFLNEIVWIAIKISLMFVPTGSVGRRQAIIRTNAS